jgi:glycerol kinase
LDPKYVLAIDQGTTSSRAILFDQNGKSVAHEQREFRQYYPKPGWVEHDPAEILDTQVRVAKDCIRKASISGSAVHSIGITNQRETTIIWDKETGQPVYNAIVWQDRRTEKRCQELIDNGMSGMIARKTGLVIDPYFSATKIQWILEHEKRARQLASKGRLAFGTVDTWLIWNLTGGRAFVTDVTNASRTMLFNIHTMGWDRELMDLFQVHESMLPEVVGCSEIIGETDPSIFNDRWPISGIAGDQQASMFGQMCVREGMIKNTYGTGCFLLMNTGEQPVLSKNKLVTTIAWKMGGRVQYALEGSVFVAGAVIQWLRDELELIRSASEIESLAESVGDNGGVRFVPAFTGLGAPWWNSRVRGMITGLTRGTRKGHLARAALEAIGFQNYFVIQAMKADTGLPLSGMRVDGGAASNSLLMQFQADLLGAPVERSKMLENTALGAAFFAGLATGYWNSIEEIQDLWSPDMIFKPRRLNETLHNEILAWEAAVKAAMVSAE